MPLRNLDVQFHHRAEQHASIIVLAGNQRGGGSGRENPIEFWLVPERYDDLVRFRNIALTQDDVQIFKFAQRDVSVGLRGEYRPFIRDRGNVLRLEEAQNVDEFGSE